MSNIERTNDATQCPKCKAAMAEGATFCHQCGAPVSGHRTEVEVRKETRNWKSIALFMVATAAWCFVLVFVGMKFMSDKSAVDQDPHAGLAMPPAQSASSVNLSKMTPREAADRLFNRVMAADEQGRSAEVAQFGPMALAAYKRVEILDADARYHIGLISLLLGDVDHAREQIGKLQEESPDHLLAMAMAYSIAEKEGDARAAIAIRARFKSAYEKEMRSGRSEYEAHKMTIEALHGEIDGSGGNGTPGQ